MKRTKINVNVQDFPLELQETIARTQIFDSSCSDEARVYFLDCDGGLYLKTAAKGSLKKEALMTEYFHSKGLAAEVVEYLSLDRDWLLTSRVTGEDCTHADYLSEPERLCDLLSNRLRELHETDFSDCPISDHRANYLAVAEENFQKGRCDVSYFGENCTAAEAWRVLQEGKHLLKNDTLLHGDYCLPNIMLDNWRFSGFIDLGNGGVGDRHVDIFWGAWTLNFNLGTDAYRQRFFDGYGRDRIDDDILKIIAAAEVFG